MKKMGGSIGGAAHFFLTLRAALQHVARQVLVLRHFAERTIDILRIDRHALAGVIARRERHFLEQLLDDRVQAPRADVLGLLVDRIGDLRQ